MKKFSLLILFLISHLCYSQQFPSILFSNVHVINSDSLNTVYYTYKVPYNHLVFEKTGGQYSAKFNIVIEVFDAKESFVVRSFSDKKLTTGTFEQTDMRDLYVEGFNEFTVGSGEFNIIPIFSDLNSAKEVKLKPVKINTSALKSSRILEPIVVDAEKILCNNKPLTTLTNFEANFPFAEEEFHLIIPVQDEERETIYVKIVNDKDTIFNEAVSDAFISNIKFAYCSSRIVLDDGLNSVQTKNFIVKNFSNKLKAGNLVITVSKDQNSTPEKVFQKSVIWYNRPFSLNNPELAIKALKYIESETVINNLLKEKSEDYQNVLFRYWKKYDPTPNSEFNQLMSQFYQRVDFAAKNFTSIAGKNGVESDRGKILIQFGKPLKIERTSNEYGKVVETWVYENPQRTFIFVDTRGTGDFSLTKG